MAFSNRFCSISLLGIVAAFGVVSAYPYYRARIPNGFSVPDTCKPDSIWFGVGHQQRQGGGPLNPFGADFMASGHAWTQDLCQKDSDGDGLTNGQELGDPDCVWTIGAAPARTVDITNPGIQEGQGC